MTMKTAICRYVGEVFAAPSETEMGEAYSVSQLFYFSCLPGMELVTSNIH